MCRVYAVIKDDSSMKSMTVCGGIDREKEVYISQGNSVQIRLLDNIKTSEQKREHFLLKYEGNKMFSIVN